MPADLEPVRAEITDTISQYVFANRVIDARQRQRVRFRKQVTLDPDFKALWDRISQRTKYRVSFVGRCSLLLPLRRLPTACPDCAGEGPFAPSRSNTRRRDWHRQDH